MNKSNEILQRIKKRKEQKESKKQSLFFKISNRILAIICLIIAFLIYAHKDPNANVINSIFSTNINFSSINTFMQNISSSLNSFLNINQDENDKTIEVNGKPLFINTQEYHYTNSDLTAYSIGKGTITSINENEDGYVITLILDDGYTAIYEKIDYVTINYLDCVKKNTVLGYFNNEFKLSIMKNGKTYTYEEIGMFN